jgi:hypothetical protein
MKIKAIPKNDLCNKVVISLFVVLNLGTTLFMNRPFWLISRVNSASSATLGPQLQYRLDYSSWLVQRYAHLAGLDNQWQMFGRQSRFNWWFEIQGVYANGKIVDLPLPLQSSRTFWQRTFFDIKEAKYHLNLYPSDELRNRYAHYLCREYPTEEGAPIQSIVFNLHHQMLLEPREAVLKGKHLEDQSYSRVLNTFQCPPSPR